MGELFTHLDQEKDMPDTFPNKPSVPPLTTTMPDDIAHLAAMYAFGPFTKAYQAQERARALLIGCPLLLLGPPLLCVGLVALLTSSYVIADAMGLKGDTNLPQIIAFVLALIILVVFAGVAIPAGWRINASGTSVYLFQHGIIHRKGAQSTPLYWQQIARGQYIQANRSTPAKLVIKTVDGRAIVLHSIPGLKELSDRVQQALAHR